MTFNDPWLKFQGHDILNVQQLENGTRYSYSYDVRLIESRIDLRQFELLWTAHNSLQGDTNIRRRIC